MLNAIKEFFLRNTYDLDKHFGADNIPLYISLVIFFFVCAILATIGMYLCYRGAAKSKEDILSPAMPVVSLGFLWCVLFLLSLSPSTYASHTHTYTLKNGFVNEYKLRGDFNETSEYAYKVYKYLPSHNGVRTTELQKQFISKSKVYPDNSIIK